MSRSHMPSTEAEVLYDHSTTSPRALERSIGGRVNADADGVGLEQPVFLGDDILPRSQYGSKAEITAAASSLS